MQQDRPHRLDRAAFVARFGGVFEHSPWIAEQAFARGLGPQHDRAASLHQAMVAVLREAGRERQLALIQAHPDLAGRLAQRGELMADSSAEQAGAGLDRCSPEEFARFQDLNQAYVSRFGFPFVMAVKGRTRAEILNAFERRLKNDPETEFQTALAEVEQIARLRLAALLPESELNPALHDFIQARREEQIAFLRELVRVPSDNPPGDCRPHAERAAALLEGLGFEVERHPVPEATVREAGMIAATNLVIRHRFGDGPVIALNAHGDVVPPGEGWTKDPYGGEIEDGWMYGRGVAVSKSDFATYAFALLALKELAPELQGAVELHLTYDEEAGGIVGPKWLLEQGISRPDYAISAAFSYAVIIAHNGCLHLEVEIRGRSAHAALPATGVDALEAASGVLAALYGHRATLAEVHSTTPGIDSPSLVVGLISGGINTNVVPDRVTFRLDRRLVPEEDAAAVEEGLRRLIEATATTFPGVTCGVRRILLAEPLVPVGTAGHLTRILQREAEAVLGEAIPAQGVPLYTDARHYAAAGIPTVLFGAGPRTIEEANAHRADERLPLATLAQASEITARAIAVLLGDPGATS
jgi:OHCU decarboxylase